MIAGVPKETLPGERGVALTPAAAKQIIGAGLEVVVESGAGLGAGFPDEAYAEAGATAGAGRDEVFATAGVICQMKGYGANPDAGEPDVARFRSGQIAIGFQEPLTAHEQTMALAERGVGLLAMELIPRITRAQSMDALSSMATVAGYKGVLLAANEFPRFFPMFMTAAGTVTPARVLVVGVGVAGLQAIATAKRLGAVVSAYDVRPAVKEQVESLGGKFVELDLATEDAEDAGGYAKAQDADFYARQQASMSDVIAAHQVVITTAAVPGRRSPVLVTASMVERMEPGSIIVDLASERGGNCEVTKPGETITYHDVTVVGPVNLTATMPYHASFMYGNNVAKLVKHLAQDGEIALDTSDEITRETLVCNDGEIVHPRVRELVGLPAPADAEAAPDSEAGDG